MVLRRCGSEMQNNWFYQFRGYWLLIFLFSTGRDSLVLVKLLRKEYKRRSQLRPLLWNSTIQLPIEQVYTRLKIVSRRRLGIQMEDDEEGSYEEESYQEESDEEESDEKESYEEESYE